MSQHDMVLDNEAGAAYRADNNNALLALVSNSSGATEPATMYAYQWWADTTTGLLKQRNAANSAWIIKSKLASDMIAALQKQEFTAFTTGGTATAYTLTTSPVMAALTTNECFRVNFHTTSGTTPTLARDGLTAKFIKQYDSSGAKVAAAVTAGQLCYVEYDGTDYVVLNPLPSTYPATEKLPAGTCTQAAGALTFVMPACVYDFRSTTLTSGAVTQVSGTPDDLVLPSGATLGSVTTVSARIVRVLINNAGTLEQAIVNISGGNDLSETGIIDTTAIGTGSDSANVFYSTTARTGVAYKVVGIVDAVNTAGAWGDPTLVQGAGGEVLNSLLSGPVLGTAVATTSGTSIDFTGIPSWVKRITVMFSGVSSNGTSVWQLQLGTSGGLQATGYLGSYGYGQAPSSNLTTGFGVYNDLATDIIHGSITLHLANSSTNTWVCNGLMARSTRAYQLLTAGAKTLSGTLDSIRLTTVNGTDTFDAGSVNIMWE